MAPTLTRIVFGFDRPPSSLLQNFIDQQEEIILHASRIFAVRNCHFLQVVRNSTYSEKREVIASKSKDIGEYWSTCATSLAPSGCIMFCRAWCQFNSLSNTWLVFRSVRIGGLLHEAQRIWREASIRSIVITCAGLSTHLPGRLCLRLHGHHYRLCSSWEFICQHHRGVVESASLGFDPSIHQSPRQNRTLSIVLCTTLGVYGM